MSRKDKNVGQREVYLCFRWVSWGKRRRKGRETGANEGLHPIAFSCIWMLFFFSLQGATNQNRIIGDPMNEVNNISLPMRWYLQTSLQGGLTESALEENLSCWYFKLKIRTREGLEMVVLSSSHFALLVEGKCSPLMSCSVSCNVLCFSN